MTAVGLEPTHPKIVELESTALKHSAKLSMSGRSRSEPSEVYYRVRHFGVPELSGNKGGMQQSLGLIPDPLPQGFRALVVYW